MIDVVGRSLWVGVDVADYGRLQRAVAETEVGGAVFFRRNGEDWRAAHQWLAGLFASSNGCIAAIDQEGGRVRRLGSPMIELPSMRKLCASHSADEIQQLAMLAGRQLRALGFTLNFAPVADVDTNPANPVIGDRAFSRDVQKVIEYATAYADGLRQAGVASCAKHFPGHGDADVDSHLALPTINHDRARLDAVELAAFRGLVGVVDSVMTAHLVVPAIDEKIATLSARTLQILRDEYAFGGVVVSDDLLMRGVSSGLAEDVAAVAIEALAAGCDALLICADADVWKFAYARIKEEAARSGAFAERLEQAAARTQKLRRKWIDRPVDEIERQILESQSAAEEILRAAQPS